MANDIRTAELSLKIAGQTSITNAAPKREFAIVSPCSTCQNFTQAASGNDSFRSLCPRRIWIQQSQQNSDEPGIVDPVLSTSGTDDPNKLVNPVVDPITGNYIVWVASVEDNQGIVDPANGDPVVSSILSADFNNLYIKCRLYPYVPEQHHDTLRSQGAFQENDKVVATEHRIPALNPEVKYNNPKVMYTETPIAGTVSKTTFAYYFNTVNPDDHALVAG